MKHKKSPLWGDLEGLMSIKKEMAVIALSNSESHPGSYALILEDTDNKKRIPIIIGVAEAQAIAISMERMKPARPLTHDLLKNIMDGLSVKLKEVLIHSVIEGIFHAALILEKEDKTTLTIDARTSDAIALAVRFDAPIYAYENVIEEAGIMSEIFSANSRKGSFSEYTLEELEALLQKLLDKEDYESAVRIRDLIDKRKEN
jgi:uncharacterized protein